MSAGAGMSMVTLSVSCASEQELASKQTEGLLAIGDASWELTPDRWVQRGVLHEGLHRRGHPRRREQAPASVRVRAPVEVRMPAPIRPRGRATDQVGASTVPARRAPTTAGAAG